MPCLHKLPSVRDPEVSQFFSNMEFQRSRKHNADNTIHCNIKQPFSLKKTKQNCPLIFLEWKQAAISWFGDSMSPS